MGRNVVALADDALVIDEDVRGTFDEDDRRITVTAGLVNMPPYDW
jgi:hypothetical protein